MRCSASVASNELETSSLIAAVDAAPPSGAHALLTRASLAEGISYLRRSDPRLRAWIDRIGVVGLRRHRHRFGALAKAILSQQLAARAAETIHRRFLARFAPLRAPDPARAGFVISELGADVVALQEVLRPFDEPDPLERLAESLRLHLAFVTTRVHRRGEIGNAILSRWPITSVFSLDLSFSRVEKRSMLDHGVTIRTPGRSGFGSTVPKACRTPTWPASITITLDVTSTTAPMTVRSHAPVRSIVAPAVPPDARRPAAAVNSKNAATRIAPPSIMVVILVVLG